MSDTKKALKKIIEIAIAYVATCLLQWIVPFDLGDRYSHSLFSVAMFVLFALLMCNPFCVREKRGYLHVFGAVLSVLYVMARSVSVNGVLQSDEAGLWLAMAVYAPVCARICEMVYLGIDWLYAKRQEMHLPALFERIVSFPYRLWQMWIALFLCWIPVWLAVYPGEFLYDMDSIIYQFETGEYTAQHTLLHTLLVGNILKYGWLTLGSANKGIAIYCLLQMAVVSFFFAKMLHYIRYDNGQKWLAFLTFCYLVLFPLIPLSAGCSTKDVMYSVFVTALCLCLVRMWGQERMRIRDMIGLACLIFLTIIYRATGIYATILFFAIALLICRRQRKQLLIPLAIALAMYFLYVGPFYSAMGVEPTNNREMLSLPMQQLANVYHNGEMTDEERETLEELIDGEVLEEDYTSRLADPIKNWFVTSRFDRNPGKYIDLYFAVGKKNVNLYVSTFIDMTEPYWYPDDIVDGYTRGTQDLELEGTIYEDGCFWAIGVESEGTDRSKIVRLHDILWTIMLTDKPQQIPLVSMLFAPGCIFLCILWMGMCFVKKGQRKGLLPVAYCLIVVLAALVGPVAIVRYILPLYYSLPLVASLWLAGLKGENHAV